MAIIIDDATISMLSKLLTGTGASITVSIGYLYKKGYIDIWLSKLFTPSEVIRAVKRQNGNALEKLNMSDEVVSAVKKQNGNAIAKLNTPDDVMCILNSFEVNADGRIALKGEGRVNKLLHVGRALTDSEKDEIIKVIRKILTCD